jgi:cobalt/nickel transport system permease protein
VSRGAARTNLAILVAFLIVLSHAGLWMVASLGALALGFAIAARLPPGKLLLRGIVVLPLPGLLALAAWLSGDVFRAITLLMKSYVSIVAVLVFNAVTPFPAWSDALHAWRVPNALILTLQFVYRYIFVIAEEGHRMRLAARNRGGFRFDSAAGAIGVLFARSWRRSEMVHRAMVARGFRGKFT